MPSFYGEYDHTRLHSYKGFDVSTWYGLFMPAAAPKDAVARVQDEVNRLLATPEMVAAIQAQGAEPKAMGADAFAQLLKTDYLQWRDIVRNAGATVE